MKLTAYTPVTDDLAHSRTRAFAEGSGISFELKVVIGIVVWALMSLAAAFHWFGTSVDYFNYVAFYNGLPYELSAGNSRFEGGFVLLSWLFKYVLNVDYDVLALFVVASSLAIKFYLFFRYLRSPLLAIFVYLMIFYPLYEYTQVRAALASGLVYFSIHSLLERKYYLAFTLLAGAVVFHASAVIVAILVAIFIFARRPLGVAIAFFCILAIAIWYEEISSTVAGVLPLVNPFAIRYLDNIYADTLPTVWSVQNMCLLSAILSTAFVSAKSKITYDYLLMFLGLSGLAMLLIFYNSPVLAQRGKEILTLSTIFYVFRGQFNTRYTAFALMFLCGAWSLYRAISEGIIGA